MSRLSRILEEALRECEAAPPGARGTDMVVAALERAERRVSRLPKPPKPETALNRSARKRLEAMEKKP